MDKPPRLLWAKRKGIFSMWLIGDFVLTLLLSSHDRCPPNGLMTSSMNIQPCGDNNVIAIGSGVLSRQLQREMNRIITRFN